MKLSKNLQNEIKLDVTMSQVRHGFPLLRKSENFDCGGGVGWWVE